MRPGEAAIGLRDQTDARIGIALYDGNRAVARAVVDDDDLEIGKGLVDERIERFADRGRGVIGRNDDAGGGRQVLHDKVLQVIFSGWPKGA